jgi:hypothetical protein
MQTPDFPAWRARFAACGRRIRTVRQHSLHQLEALVGSYFPAWLLAPADEGPNSRRRVFCLRRTFFGFLYQVLHPNCACRTIVRQIQALERLDGGRQVDGGTSAYCQARWRLPLDILQRVRHAIAGHIGRLLPEDKALWHGLCPKVIDGTTVSAPDTPKNQRAYPQSSTQAPGCGFPMIKLVGIFSLCSGALLDYAKGNKHQHELRLLHTLLDQFKPGDLALADRGFCGYALIASLLGQGVQSLFRLHQARSTDLRRGKRLGKQDRLFTWRRTRQKPPYLSCWRWMKIPEELTVRVLRFQLHVPGYRANRVTLVTTLLDPKRYPAEELARLYARRWCIELWFRDIKTTLGMEVLHCRTPRMLHKELEMYFIAYNLLRALGVEAALCYDVPLQRISFKGTLDALSQFSLAILQARSKKKRRQLAADLLFHLAADQVPERPGRSEPRALKRRPKPFPLLNKHRHRFRPIPHKSRYRRNHPAKPRP